jgi:hypothetical protein
MMTRPKPLHGTRKLKKDELVLRNYGYGHEELIQFKYYVNTRWARGVSLTWPGVWQHFDTMECRRPIIL